MAYKDPDKQREANRQAQQRRRELVRQGTEGGEGMTDAEIDNVYKGMTKEGNVIPDHPVPVLLKQGVTEQEVTPEQVELLKDIFGKEAVEEVVPETPDTTSPKRGKDIKVFADLPPHVQQTINRVSESNKDKYNRTATAIKYQHLFYSPTDTRAKPVLKE